MEGKMILIEGGKQFDMSGTGVVDVTGKRSSPTQMGWRKQTPRTKTYPLMNHKLIVLSDNNIKLVRNPNMACLVS